MAGCVGQQLGWLAALVDVATCRGLTALLTGMAVPAWRTPRSWRGIKQVLRYEVRGMSFMTTFATALYTGLARVGQPETHAKCC